MSGKKDGKQTGADSGCVRGPGLPGVPGDPGQNDPGMGIGSDNTEELQSMSEGEGVEEEGWGESVADESIRSEENVGKAKLRLAENAAQGEVAVLAARLEPDLGKRARAMIRLGAVNFPEEKPVQSGGMVVMQPLLSDINYHAVYDALFGTELPKRPHFDTFRGMPVDHDGEILDDRRPISGMLAAISATGLKGTRASEIRRTYRDWIMNERMNDLQHRFNSIVPEWDGEPRLATFLVDLMKPKTTTLNLRFGQYFWLSLYCRIHYPGCFAPMALSLFGAQNAGKSYLGKLICRELIGRDSADSVPLDLGADRNTFLRAITGASVIANVGEMTGFGRGDLNKIKDFMTRTSDLMDQKYEKHIDQPRQWIVMMDGNKYEGLQRDETGNRRFYPMFVGQLDDRGGQPTWDEKFKVDYAGFESGFWQVMSECRLWVEKHGGVEGYIEFAREVVAEVQAFSVEEMAKDRGTIKDDMLDMLLPVIMKKVRASMYEGRRKKGIWIRKSDIYALYDKMDRKGKLIPSHLKLKMSALGGLEEQIHNEKGFLFDGFDNLDEFTASMKTAQYNSIDDEDVRITEIRQGDDENGGF